MAFAILLFKNQKVKIYLRHQQYAHSQPILWKQNFTRSYFDIDCQKFPKIVNAKGVVILCARSKNINVLTF